MVINMIFPQQGKDRSWVGTPPAIGEICLTWKTKATTDPMSALSSGGTNLGQFQGIDPRGGAEFDENGPNLTETSFL